MGVDVQVWQHLDRHFPHHCSSLNRRKRRRNTILFVLRYWNSKSDPRGSHVKLASITAVAGPGHGALELAPLLKFEQIENCFYYARVRIQLRAIIDQNRVAVWQTW